MSQRAPDSLALVVVLQCPWIQSSSDCQMLCFDCLSPISQKQHTFNTVNSIFFLQFSFSFENSGHKGTATLEVQIDSLTWHVLAETWDGNGTRLVSGVRHVEVSRLKRVASAPLLVKVRVREIVWPTTCEPKSTIWLSTSS